MQKIKINQGVVSTRNARDYLIQTYLNDVGNNPNIKNRLVKDVRKFLNALKTNEIFTVSEIGKLFSGNWRYFENSRYYHAEMRLLLSMKNKFTEPTTITIGISKLCCRLCASGVAAFKKRYQHLKIDLRGRHGNFYFGWIPPRLLLEECFKDFVGERAHEIYLNALEGIRVRIEATLYNLEGNRGALGVFFTPQRGGVNLKSDSPAPLTTTESETSDAASELSTESSVYPEDSDSDSEN